MSLHSTNTNPEGHTEREYPPLASPDGTWRHLEPFQPILAKSKHIDLQRQLKLPVSSSRRALQEPNNPLLLPSQRQLPLSFFLQLFSASPDALAGRHHTSPPKRIFSLIIATPTVKQRFNSIDIQLAPSDSQPAGLVRSWWVEFQGVRFFWFSNVASNLAVGNHGCQTQTLQRSFQPSG